MERYELLEKVGSGTYGIVHKARQLDTNSIVAIKQILLENLDEDGIPSTAIREIALLKDMQMMTSAGGANEKLRRNIVELIEVIHTNTPERQLCLVFEYVTTDLKKFIDEIKAKRKLLMRSHSDGDVDLVSRRGNNARRLMPIKQVMGSKPTLATPIQVGSKKNKDGSEAEDEEVNGQKHAGDVIPFELCRSFAYQLLCGVAHCHSLGVLHRDLKPPNILLSSKGILKIADFGLARALNLPLRSYTHEVVTLWYRCPEILLGAKYYSTPVDVWSVGCILAELLSLNVMFQGDSEIGQLMKIFNKLGTPTSKTWQHVEELPDYKFSFPKWKGRSVKDIFKEKFNELKVSEKDAANCVELLEQLLCYNPNNRITARNALDSPLFKISSGSRSDVNALISPTATSQSFFTPQKLTK